MRKPLTIGIDIRDLRVSTTGIKTYLEELCREFKKLESDEIRFRFLDSSLPVYKGNNRLFKLAEHAKYQLWKQIGLPLKAFFNACDIVFCTDNFVPLIHLGYQTIPVFHDAFFFENPENYGKLWLWLYKITALPAARRSPFVVTPTCYAQKQIHYFTGIPIEKLVVVYEAPKSSDTNLSDQDDAILQKLNLLAGAYLLHAGSMVKRKNLPLLIKAFEKVKTDYPRLKLVLAGPIQVSSNESDFENICDAITKAGLTDEVVLPGYLSDHELTKLYRNAALYVFPSLNEGFGIPVLEAFKYDLPVLTADNSCLPEVGANAILTFNPFDVDDIAQKIKEVLSDDMTRQDMILKGRERLKDFSWQKTAIDIIEIFKKAAER